VATVSKPLWLVTRKREWYFTAMGKDSAVNNSFGLSGGLLWHSGNWLGIPDGPIKEAMAAGRLPSQRSELEEIVEEPRCLSTCAEPMSIGASGVVIAEFCAGGGYGHPLCRHTTLVAADVSLGAITKDMAERAYGVALDEIEEVLEEATETLRKEIRSSRLL
jgi:N-methylhydantoinase B